jgi:hypothetical protein
MKAVTVGSETGQTEDLGRNIQDSVIKWGADGGSTH